MSGRREAPSPVLEWRKLVLASDVGGGAVTVALVLSVHMDRNGGSCFPKQETIAREGRLGRRTVQRALKELEAADLLDVTPGGGRGRPSRYRIKGVPLAPFRDVKGVTGDAEKASQGPSRLSLEDDQNPYRKKRRSPRNAAATERLADLGDGNVVDLSAYDIPPAEAST